MIYTCNECHFTFSRVGKIETCPDCGKPFIREATEKEKREYKKYQSLREDEKNKKDL